jgi:hypothetical protein
MAHGSNVGLCEGLYCISLFEVFEEQLLVFERDLVFGLCFLLPFRCFLGKVFGLSVCYYWLSVDGRFGLY